MTEPQRLPWKTEKRTDIFKKGKMDILKFITAGSVDDGKSTLIGRLLHDSKAILRDQLTAIKQQSNNEEGEIDLALLTDGLRAEREQGITIDVAYKYFSTPIRKFIIADAPGHVQYTRNMVTGASNCDLAILLIDARIGVSEQTKRHSIIVSLLKIPHVVVAINKMDLVDYSQDVYNNIVSEFQNVVKTIGLNDVTYIPISAKKGDNIVAKSDNLSWYEGESLLHYLEHVAIEKDINLSDARFPVQYVIRPQSEQLHDYRGYAGKIISGIYRKGDKITILPSGAQSTILAIEIANREVEEAFANQSAVFQLVDDVDVSRGDLIVKADNMPKVEQEFQVLLCWMDNKPLLKGSKYLLQINSLLIKSIVKEIKYRVDVKTLLKEFSPGQAELNDIVEATIRTASSIPYDSYSELRSNGSGILIDETSNATVGAIIIQKP